MWLLAVAGIVAAMFGLTVLVGAPFVPSLRRDVALLFDELKIGPDDAVLDIGAGDGVVLSAAAARGARAIGVEINPLLVVWARWRTRHYRQQVRLIWGDARRMKPIEKVTVLYCFGAGPFVNSMAMIARRQAAAQGMSLRLVSYGFAVPGLGRERRIGPYKVYTVRG
ncbi:MAG: methyltransferase domain-containing protein [Candidatus Saccharibacteria bacterium]|nr:methyltransferase domain-containing protein [Candidatus Saccharibacteria bacterium]